MVLYNHKNSIFANFSKMMYNPTIILFPGHSPENIGANNGELKENKLAIDLCELITTEFEKNNFPYIFHIVHGDTQTEYLKERIRITKDIYNHEKNIIAVSIHFDSSDNRNAKGSHCIYYPKSTKGKQIAEKISDRLVKIFPGRSQKTVARKLYFLRHTPCPACLIETCFISNDDDMKVYLRKKKSVARGIVSGIKEYINSLE